MRLHEAIRNLNIGLDTAAEFLASKGMPLGENGGYPPTKNGDIRSLLCA